MFLSSSPSSSFPFFVSSERKRNTNPGQLVSMATGANISERDCKLLQIMTLQKAQHAIEFDQPIIFNKISTTNIIDIAFFLYQYLSH